MSWSAPIDIYCERTAALFWAEPVNAATNAAFLVAALAIALMARRAGERDAPVLALAAVTALIGVGSFLFHTFATRWAALADIIPIALFVFGYTALAVRRFLGFGRGGAMVALVLLIATAWAVMQLAPVVAAGARGALGYVPALGALIVVAWLVWVRAAHAEAWFANPKNRAYGAAGEVGRWEEEEARVHRPRAAARTMFLCAGLFALSLAFRTIDGAACAVLPIGTHFLWHVMNAAVLYGLMRAAFRHGPAR